MKRIILTLLITLLLATSCVRVVVKSEKAVVGESGKYIKTVDVAKDFEILQQGAYGGRDNAENLVITTSEKFQAITKELNFQNSPDIDFSKKQVVVLFMGQKSTGGFSIGIESVRKVNDTAEVVIKETQPDGIVTMALTQPYCVAVIPKTPKVKFLQEVK